MLCYSLIAIAEMMEWWRRQRAKSSHDDTCLLRSALVEWMPFNQK
jgi:hypothetical protein